MQKSFESENAYLYTFAGTVHWCAKDCRLAKKKQSSSKRASKCVSQSRKTDGFSKQMKKNVDKLT